MCSVGLEPLFMEDRTSIDIVQFINNAFLLLKEQQKNIQVQSEFNEMFVKKSDFIFTHFDLHGPGFCKAVCAYVIFICYYVSVCRSNLTWKAGSR